MSPVVTAARGIASGIAVLYACHEIATDGPSGFWIIVLILFVPAAFLSFRMSWREMMLARRLKKNLLKARLKRLARLSEKRG